MGWSSLCAVQPVCNGLTPELVTYRGNRCTVRTQDTSICTVTCKVGRFHFEPMWWRGTFNCNAFFFTETDYTRHQSMLQRRKLNSSNYNWYIAQSARWPAGHWIFCNFHAALNPNFIIFSHHLLLIICYKYYLYFSFYTIDFLIIYVDRQQLPFQCVQVSCVGAKLGLDTSSSRN